MAMPFKGWFRARRRSRTESDPLADWLKTVDQLADLARRASELPEGIVTSDVEAGERAVFRIVKGLSEDRFDAAECARRLEKLPEDATLARDMLDWLLRPSRPRIPPVPPALVDATGILAAHATRLAGDARDNFVRHPALAALNVVTASKESVQDVGKRALRLFKSSDGGLARQSQALTGAVRNLVLWPKDTATAFHKTLCQEIKRLEETIENVGAVRERYESARRVEVAASNLNNALAELRRGALTLPARARRAPGVGTALEDIVQSASRRKSLGTFASGVWKYARDVLDFLHDKWGKATAAGVGLIVPAALIKQWVASLSAMDVSWADPISKLDPVDGFKLPLVALVCGACIASVLLTFRHTRRRVVHLMTVDNDPKHSMHQHSAGRFIARNAALSGLAALLIYCGVAFAVWSGKGAIVSSAEAAEGPAIAGSPETVALKSATGIFRPILTFGNVRVLRCASADCRVGPRTMAFGEPVTVPSKEILADAAAGRGDVKVVLAPEESATRIEVVQTPWNGSELVLKHTVEVNGSVALTGASPAEEPTLTLAVDEKSADALSRAMGKALARIRFPAMPTHLQVELPEGFQRDIAGLAAPFQANPNWLSRLLDISGRRVTAADRMAEIADKQLQCNKKKLNRSFGTRVSDGWKGYDCSAP